MEKKFPDHMIPLENTGFDFSCHPGVACFTLCCKNVDMFLFPYDIIRMKNCLKVDSESFLRNYTYLTKGAHPYFPSMMLKLTDDRMKACPFLVEDGCSIYSDRPSSCRTYPLERAVDRDPGKKAPKDYYFLTKHPYCLGHGEGKLYTVKEWIRHQKIDPYNLMNDLWAEMDSIFLNNPWKGEGSGGPRQQLAFMVCYNIDAFRKYVSAHDLLQQFRFSRDEKQRLESEDGELLKFGFQWLKLLLTGKTNLRRR